MLVILVLDDKYFGSRYNGLFNLFIGRYGIKYKRIFECCLGCGDNEGIFYINCKF